jgi:hypothetical protein
VGELIERLGFRPVCRAVLYSFLYNNFLVDRLDRRRFERLAALSDFPKLTPVLARKLRSALNGLMVMSHEFRYDTARLFLTMFGRSRDIRRELAADPLELFAADPKVAPAVERLVHVLSG